MMWIGGKPSDTTSATQIGIVTETVRYQEKTETKEEASRQASFYWDSCFGQHKT